MRPWFAGRYRRVPCLPLQFRQQRHPVILGQRLTAKRAQRAFRRLQPVNPFLQLEHLRAQGNVVASRLLLSFFSAFKWLSSSARSASSRSSTAISTRTASSAAGCGRADRFFQFDDRRFVAADFGAQFGAGSVQLALERPALLIQVA